MTPSIAALQVYPVKSCRGISVAGATLTERGLQYDRQWMIVEDGGDPALFVTQRDIPRLALIATSLTESSLVLAAPGMKTLGIDFDTEGPRRQVVVWRDTVAAIDQGEAVSAWLSEFVGAAVRMVRFDNRSRRLCNPEYAGDTGAHTGFADGYPLLIIGADSLRDLNRKLQEGGSPVLPMNRFRPNLVVDGLEAFDEDHLASLTFGDVELKLVKPCVRCQITTTDQATAAIGDEPLRTLARYRNNPRLGGVTFGMNAIVARGAGSRLAVGATAAIDWAF